MSWKPGDSYRINLHSFEKAAIHVLPLLFSDFNLNVISRFAKGSTISSDIVAEKKLSGDTTN